MVKGIILGLSLIVFVFAVSKHYFDLKGKVEKQNRTRFLVRVAVFGGFSAILYCIPFLKFPVPFFPSFLEFHFDEIPAFIAAFAYGPMTGLYVLLVKTFIKLPLTTTLCVGEIADLIYSIAFILPGAIYYQRNRTLKGAIKSLIIGLVCQLTVSLVTNVYVTFPFYMQLFEISEENMLRIFQATNPAVRDIRWSVGFIAVLPFNAMKDAMIIIPTMLVYKSTHTLFDKIQK